MKFGYARVSSNTQDHAAQVEALKAAGCARIYSEKASGKSTKGRPEFAKLMKALNYGDVVTVVKLDRLARSSRDLQNILHELQEMGCGFVSLGESWCDTTTDVGRLMMAIMAGIAEFERSLIRKRCEDGIDLPAGACADDLDLQSHGVSRCFHLPQIRLSGRDIRRIDEHRYTGRCWQ